MSTISALAFTSGTQQLTFPAGVQIVQHFALEHFLTVSYCYWSAPGGIINKTAGKHRLIFRQTTNVLISFCKVKNETAVLNLSFKGFLKISIPPLNSKFHAKERYHDFPSRICCFTVTKNFAGEPFMVSQMSGIEKFNA